MSLTAFLSLKSNQPSVEELLAENQSLKDNLEITSSKVSELQQTVSTKDCRISELEHRVSWFERQYLGKKSEKRMREADPNQLSLGEVNETEAEPPKPGTTVAGYQRGTAKKKDKKGTPEDSGLRFDESKTPVVEIELPTPEIEGLSKEEYKLIGEDVSYKLAQASCPSTY